MRLEALKSGFALLQEGRFDQARDAVAPWATVEDLEARLLYGLALGGSFEPEAAAGHLTTVARARPANTHPCLDLLGLLHRRYRGRDAEAAFLACLTLTPDDWKLQLSHGQLLYELGRSEEAMAAVERSLALSPGQPSALNQRAIVLIALGHVAEGLALFRDVVARDPRNAPAWANLGCTLANEGVFEEALSAYRQSIQLKPAEPQVRLNHSICLLKAGRMVQGWQEHEWRLSLPGHTELPPGRMLPTLRRETSLAGRSVLVTHEEGLGDTLMYLRFVPLLARLGARVLVWAPPAVARLAARVEGVAGVVATDDIRLEADWHCPMISLPRAFSGTPQALGLPPPYLNTDPDRVAALAGRLPPARDRRLRVGLAWGGAPRPENLAANMVDRKRSIGLAALAPLARLRHVELVSLQVGPYADELRAPPPGLAITDPMQGIADMDDTASLMRHLDVVVSVDTSVVHLAGGLGLPTILLDRYDNCWRWLHGRTDSPWYPSLTIVRQTSQGDWAGVVDRLLPMLQTMADARRRKQRAA